MLLLIIIIFCCQYLFITRLSLSSPCGVGGVLLASPVWGPRRHMEHALDKTEQDGMHLSIGYCVIGVCSCVMYSIAVL